MLKFRLLECQCEVITDGLVPADENDRSIPYCHWWPKKNTTEWITYTFPEAKEIKASTVNFDPVKTKAVKLELKQPETHSCGLFEWSVK